MAAVSIRDVSTLPISPKLIEKLLENGFRFVSDLASIKPLELSKEISISVDAALSIIRAVDSSRPEKVLDKISSAKDLLANQRGNKFIITFARSVDNILGGGIPIGQVTEICGVPGVGYNVSLRFVSLVLQALETI